MSNLASSYKGAAQATAFSRGMSPDRFAERSEAYASKEASDQKLELLQKTKPTDADYEKQSEINSQNLDIALGQLSQQKREQNLQSTYQAFQRYDADKFDVKHFNQLLTDFDARGAQLFSAINRVDKIIDSPEDRKVMDDWGISKSNQDSIINDPQHNASYVIITGADGTKSFGDMDALKRFAGGYNDYATAQEITRQTDIKTKEMLLSVGLPTDKMSVQAFNETKQKFPDVPADDEAFLEAYRARYEELRTTGRSRGYENKTEFEQRVLDKLEQEGLRPGDEGYIDRKVELTRELEDYKKRPSTLRNLEAAEDAQNELAEMPFFNQKDEETQMKRKDLSRSEELNIENKIRVLEQAGEQKLDTETRKALMRIRELAHLGGKASGMTDKETGFWDNFVFRAKKYFVDDTTGIEATAAFAEYSNLNRHAMFGSVLPAAEITSHIQSFGSVGLQQGPILEHLRGSVEKLKNNYETLASMNNPLVFEWRAGMTETDLDNTIARLERQLYEIDAVYNNIEFGVQSQNIKPDKKVELLPEWEKTFDETFPEGDKE